MPTIDKKICATLILSCGFMFVSPAVGLNAESISSLEGKKQSLQNEMNGVKEKISQKVADQDATVQEIERLNGSIQETEGVIQTLNGQLIVQQGIIDTKNAEIAALEKKYQERKKIFEERLVEIYATGDISYLEVLLEAESFSDFLTRYEYMSFIAVKDQDLLKDLEAVRLELESQRQALQAEKETFEAMKASQVQKEASLQAEKGTQEDFYKQLENDKAALEAFLAEQQAEADQVAAEIYRLQQEEEARRRASAAAAAAAAAQQADASRSADNVTFAESYQVNTGSILWPVPGYNGISSRYGGRVHPIYGVTEFHLGTDIPAPSGTPVVSVTGGTVMMSNNAWSYGNNVVVYHDNGMSTLYAHLSGFNCAPGQRVEAGQVIGYVGSTGASTGAHLHFEVHINGQRVNPEAYLGV